MDLTLLVSIFTTVFLAELGDKTQLATFALSGATNRPYAVFLGSSSALILSSLIGALAGGSISNIVPEKFLEAITSIIFLYIGSSLLISSINDKNEK